MKVFQWIRALIGAVLGLAIALWMEMTPESGLTGLIVGAFIGIAVAENFIGGAVGLVAGYFVGDYTVARIDPEIGYVIGMIGAGIAFAIIGLQIGKIFGEDAETLLGYFGFIIGLAVAWVRGWMLGIIIGCAVISWLICKKLIVSKTHGTDTTAETLSLTQNNFQMSEARSVIKRSEITFRNAVSSGIQVPEDVEKHLADAQKAFASEKFIAARTHAQDFLKGMEPFLKELDEQKEQRSSKTMELVKTDMLRKDTDAGIRFARLSLDKALEFGISPLGKEQEALKIALDFFDKGDYENAMNSARSCKNETDRRILESKPDIVITLPQKMQFNFWKQHDIMIKNIGTMHARDITVGFPDSIKIRDIETIPMLRVGEQQTLRINMKPTEAGEVPVDYTMRFSDLHNRIYMTKHTAMIQINGSDVRMSEERTAEHGPDIKRGYEVLPNNDMRFGIRVENNSGFAIMDVQVFLDHPKSLLSLHGSEIQYIGNIDPGGKRTASFVLKPLGCIHNEKLNGIITYKDHTGNKHTMQMRPKEVHCVRPFMKEKPMTESEYRSLTGKSEQVQEGISFKGISPDEMSGFIGETCRHLLYKVREYDLDGRRVFYLSGEALGEKAYYLLTAVIQEVSGITQVMLSAHSDRKYGLNGFINEMADSIRHLASTIQSAKEMGIIEKTQVINIIDSVVQRTNFDFGQKGGAVNVNTKDSVIQRSNIAGNENKTV